MKQLITFLLFLQVSFLSAQFCDIANGDLEVWEDVSDIVELSEPLPPETILLPEGYFGFLRFLFSALGDILGGLAGDELFDFAEDLFGVDRVTDATSGQFALQLGGDENLPLADLIGVFDCSLAIPDTFYIDVRHVGNGTDTLFIQGSLGPDSEIPFDTLTLINDVAASFSHTLVSNQDTEYETLAIPVVDNENGIDSDTLILFMLVSGDQEFLASGELSAFRLDNLRFRNGNVLALDDFDLSGHFASSHNYIQIENSAAGSNDEVTLERSESVEGPYETIYKLEDRYAEVYKDYRIEENTVYFYRAKVTDLLGEIFYTDLLSISTQEIDQAVTLDINPNPISSEGVIELELDLEIKDANCFIYNASGSMVKKITLPTTLNNGVNRINVSMEDLAVGHYTCQVISVDNVWTTSFVKI